MSFTDDETRQWHEDRKTQRSADDATAWPPKATCGHCGIEFGDAHGAAGSDFPLCPACDGD